MMDLEKLNPEQRDAVNTIDGPLLVLAGAGSGKTRVVTYRIVNLIQKGVEPSKILGLTFTNKAAAEMNERIQALTQCKVLICTFHSLGARILRESIHNLGYKNDFIIYDENDTEKLIKDCLSELGIGEKNNHVKNYQNKISKAKNAILSPDEVDHEDALPKMYRLYQSKLKEYNALDFDDLLFLTVKLFRECPTILKHYQDRWSHLLIDEYQDTNHAQYEIVHQLVREHHNICVVGDPDQSIYSWRGANVNNILDFEHDYPGTKVIRLEQNYRSRANILAAANQLIEHNQRRFEKELWSNLGPGDTIKHFIADNEKDEADFVAERIRYHYEQQDIPLHEMAVFYRTNAQSRALEDRLIARRIPYVIIGGVSFYQRKEIKDILAFLRMAYSGTDLMSFIRTLNIPKRGIGEATIDKLRLAAAQENRTLFSYCEQLINEQPLQNPVRLPTKQREGLKEYVSIIHELKESKKHSIVSTLVKQAIELTDYLNYIAADKETFEDRKSNLDALVAKAIEWETSTTEPTLANFLEELSLKASIDEADQSKERVNLMTIHNGKGLEFTVVFVVGMEEELFPHANSRDNPQAQEEERRLCYVGVTRAKEYLYLCEAQQRFLWGVTRTQRPSRFLEEISEKYLETISRSAAKRYRSNRNEYNDFYEDEEMQSSYARPVARYSKPKFDEHIEPYEIEELEKGNAVFHQQFGIGTIQEIYEGSAGLTYKILFSKDHSVRSIVAKYAHLKRL
mgnify:CR=1 FL=1